MSKLHRVDALDEGEQKALNMLIEHDKLLTGFVMPALAELLERVKALEDLPVSPED